MNYRIQYRNEFGEVRETEKAFRDDLLRFCLGRKREDILGVWKIRTGKRLRKRYYWPSVLRLAKTLGWSSGGTKAVMLKGKGDGRHSGW